MKDGSEGTAGHGGDGTIIIATSTLHQLQPGHLVNGFFRPWGGIQVLELGLRLGDGGGNFRLDQLFTVLVGDGDGHVAVLGGNSLRLGPIRLLHGYCLRTVGLGHGNDLAAVLAGLGLGGLRRSTAAGRTAAGLLQPGLSGLQRGDSSIHVSLSNTIRTTEHDQGRIAGGGELFPGCVAGATLLHVLGGVDGGLKGGQIQLVRIGSHFQSFNSGQQVGLGLVHLLLGGVSVDEHRLSCGHGLLEDAPRSVGVVIVGLGSHLIVLRSQRGEINGVKLLAFQSGLGVEESLIGALNSSLGGIVVDGFGGGESFGQRLPGLGGVVVLHQLIHLGNEVIEVGAVRDEGKVLPREVCAAHSNGLLSSLEEGGRDLHGVAARLHPGNLVST